MLEITKPAWFCHTCYDTFSGYRKKFTGRPIKGKPRKFIKVCNNCYDREEIYTLDDLLEVEVEAIDAAYCPVCEVWFLDAAKSGLLETDEFTINWHNAKWPDGHGTVKGDLQ